jgi:hypothetical protein
VSSYCSFVPEETPEIQTGSEETTEVSELETTEVDSHVENETEDETAESPAEVSISPAVAQAAASLGFSQDEIASLGSDAAVAVAIARSHRAAPVEEKPFDIDLKLDEESIDPAMLVAIKALSKTVSAEIGSLKKENAELREGMKSSRESAAIQSLPNEMRSIAADPAIRSQVVQQVAILRAGYKASGVAVPDEGTMYKQAVRMIAGDKVEEIRQEKRARKIEQRKSQGTARPTNANSPSGGDDAALNFIKQWKAREQASAAAG